jgi:1-deoxy-D-xylulose-5-phosphate reductoisomerase
MIENKYERTKMSQWITVLGATGSIGSSTLDVVRRHPARYRVYALTGFSRIAELVAAAIEFSPRFIVVPTDEAAEKANQLLIQAQQDCQVLVGEES